MRAAEVAQIKPEVAAAVDRLADELEGLSHRTLDLLVSPDVLAKAKEEFTR